MEKENSQKPTSVKLDRDLLRRIKLACAERIGGLVEIMYEWTAQTDGITVILQDGKVTSKAQFGLK